MKAIIPTLTFNNQVHQALEFYKDIFDDFNVLNIHYHKDTNTVEQAIINIHGQTIRMVDQASPKEFHFTPSMSLLIECDTLEECERLYRKLKSKGAILVALDDYGVSTRFGWVQDQFGLTWQVNLNA